MTSQKFGADAAWFKLALLAYDIANALTGLAYSDDQALRDATKDQRSALNLFSIKCSESNISANVR